MSETRYRTDWRNIAIRFDRSRHFHLIALTPWGNLVIKDWRDRLFSERYGDTPHIKVFGLCVTWRRLRASAGGR